MLWDFIRLFNSILESEELLSGVWKWTSADFQEQE